MITKKKFLENDREEIIDRLGENPDRDDLKEAFEIRKKEVDQARQQGKRWALTKPDGILDRYDEIHSRPKPLTFAIDWARCMVVWSDEIEEPIQENGDMNLRNSRLPVGAEHVCPRLGGVEYRTNSKGLIIRVERTKENKIVVRPIQEGDIDGDKAYVGGKWVLREGLIRWTPKLSLVRAKAGRVALSDFKIVRSGEWVNDCTHEEAEIYVSTRFPEWKVEII